MENFESFENQNVNQSSLLMIIFKLSHIFPHFHTSIETCDWTYDFLSVWQNLIEMPCKQNKTDQNGNPNAFLKQKLHHLFCFQRAQFSLTNQKNTFLTNKQNLHTTMSDDKAQQEVKKKSIILWFYGFMIFKFLQENEKESKKHFCLFDSYRLFFSI